MDTSGGSREAGFRPAGFVGALVRPGTRNSQICYGETSMEDSRGVRRGKCSSIFCLCDGYVPGAGGKCKNCLHLPGQHEKTQGKGSHYNQQARYTSGQCGSQLATQTQAASSRDLPSSSMRHQVHGPSHKCIICSKAAYYDAELMKQFDYCSGDCRDQDLLIRNVQDTKSDIARLELAVKGAGTLNLPMAESGGKTNCHKCDSSFNFGSAIKNKCSSVLGAIKTEIKASPVLSNAKVSHIASEASRRGQNSEPKQDPKAMQGTVKIKVMKKDWENLGLFFLNTRSSALHGCTITGYKRDSPIGSVFYRGTLNLLDVVVQVNDLNFKNCVEFNKITRKCHSVDLLCSIQMDHHVINLDKFEVPSTVTHIFALRCSQTYKSVGIEFYLGYKATIKAVTKEGLAEDSGLKPFDEVQMFTVMVVPGHTKRIEKYTEYTPRRFSEKLKEAFEEATSSLSTVLLFICRKY